MHGAGGVPIDDRGLLLGDGLFETILARAGELVLFEAHLLRMTRGCAILGLVAPDPEMAHALCERALSDSGLTGERAAVRLTLTAGSGGRGLDRPAAPSPRLFAAAAPSPRPVAPARLVVSTVRRNAGSPSARIKSLAYLDNVLARREAVAAAADEAVMLNGAGEVACAAAGNLFWIADGVLFTPDLACGVLDGVMRGAVLEAAAALSVAAREVRAPAEDLSNVEAIFLTSSLIGVRPAWLSGAPEPGLHPLMARLSEAVAAYV